MLVVTMQLMVCYAKRFAAGNAAQQIVRLMLIQSNRCKPQIDGRQGLQDGDNESNEARNYEGNQKKKFG